MSPMLRKLLHSFLYLVFICVCVEVGLQGFYYFTAGDFLFSRVGIPIYSREPYAGFGNRPATGRVVPQPSGQRLLDVITRAGGLKDQGQDTWVVLERHGRRAAVLGSLIYEPGNNIWAWPNHTIYLYKEPQTFLAFGATGSTTSSAPQGQFPFSAGPTSSAWRMTLAEAVAAAGGLLDLVADPGSVFLYRRQPRQLAEMLGVDCSKMDGPTVPIVYSVSFSDPAGYFLATRVQMHNKDIIFIFAANAQSVEITKFTTFLNALLSPGVTATEIGVNVESWRVLSQTHPGTPVSVSP
jgi:polysaccharide biosynthesis/export protein